MPFYEYQCKKCDHRLEVLQKISDEPLVYCPECNESALKKLISAAAFRLKGTGWYETDFKNNDKKKEKKSSDTAKQNSSSNTSEKKAPAASATTSGNTSASSNSNTAST